MSLKSSVKYPANIEMCSFFYGNQTDFELKHLFFATFDLIYFRPKSAEVPRVAVTCVGPVPDHINTSRDSNLSGAFHGDRTDVSVF